MSKITWIAWTRQESWYLLTILVCVALIYILSQLFYNKVDLYTHSTGQLKWEISPVKTTSCRGYEFEVKGKFIKLLASNKTFRVQLARVILQCADDIGPSASVFWECTPMFVAEEVADDCVRFCITRATILEGATPDYYTFSEHFKSPGSSEVVVTFPNLGKDAILVAPTPKGRKNFACLATWLRETKHDEESWNKVFEAVGKTLIARIEGKTKLSRTIWLSTNGAGVSWLHFRIDSYPKYYTNQHYVAMGNK